jgi:hypothetical protein
VFDLGHFIFAYGAKHRLPATTPYIFFFILTMAKPTQSIWDTLFLPVAPKTGFPPSRYRPQTRPQPLVAAEDCIPEKIVIALAPSKA